MKNQKPVTVVNDTDEAPEVLASAIRDVSAAAKKLLGGPLSERAICVLIRDCSGVGMGEILAVLKAAAGLEARYVVKKPVPKPESK